jgi:tetratricopeptide (TPR) repeat protein
LRIRPLPAEASVDKAENDAKDAASASLRAELENLRNIAAGARAEAAAQRVAFVWARQEVADRDATIAVIRGEVAERDAAIAKMHGEAAERDATIERLRGEIESLIVRPPDAALADARQPGLRFGARRKTIALADRARDAAEWTVAAHYYRMALERNPNRPEIWLQYGHVLKEAGRLSSAERAYKEAIAGAPTLAEAHRFLGDVLSIQRRRDDAVAAYRHAHALDPASPHALSALRSLGCSETDLSVTN